MDRFRLLFNFRIIRIKYFKDLEKRQAFIYALQHYYYEKTLAEKRAQLAFYQQQLTQHNFAQLLTDLTNSSLYYLQHYIKKILTYIQHLTRQLTDTISINLSTDFRL